MRDSKSIFEGTKDGGDEEKEEVKEKETPSEQTKERELSSPKSN